MYRYTTVEEVILVGNKFGMTLSNEEAKLYQKAILTQMRDFEKFVQARIDEDKPLLISGDRGPGYRPNVLEDPLNAWTWKSKIEGTGEGVLSGKTVSYKDHVAIEGMPMSIGTLSLEGFVPDFDATVVTRVLKAGGTIIGKNTMNGLSGGFGFGGGIGDYGRPLNPHNHDHVTGGSSAGSAAAVANNEVDISFGGDQGGSIRIPAAMSGVIGIKPTFGLLSHFGVGFGSDQSIDYVGPMARSVSDIATALEATAGYDGYDPRQSRDIPATMDFTARLNQDINGIKVGFVKEGFEGAETDVIDLVMSALDVLKESGAQVFEMSIPDLYGASFAQQNLMPEGSRSLFESGFFGAFSKTYYPSNLIAAVNEVWTSKADLLAPRIKLGLIAGEFSRRNYMGRVYSKAQNVRPFYKRMIDTALTKCDVLIMPTCLMKAPKYEPPSNLLEAIEEELNSRVRRESRNTTPFNFTGHPAIAMPVGKSQGLPVSMQLVGRFFDEPLLLQIANTYQKTVDWDNIISVGP